MCYFLLCRLVQGSLVYFRNYRNVIFSPLVNYKCIQFLCLDSLVFLYFNCRTSSTCQKYRSGHRGTSVKLLFLCLFLLLEALTGP